jgi:hypothetical protein
MTNLQAETKVLDIITQAAPEKLSEEDIRGKWHEADIPSTEKKQLIAEAVNSLFDQDKIKREYVTTPLKPGEKMEYRYFTG